MNNELLAPGNLIQFNGEIGIIRQVDNKKAFVEFKNRKCDVNREDMQGVEITTECLNDLGFKPTGHIGTYYLPNDATKLTLMDLGSEYQIRIAGLSKQIHFLHQLQNISAFFGLEIKLQVSL